jgi:hypothetical protein
MDWFLWGLFAPHPLPTYNQEIVTYISVSLQVMLLHSRNNLRAFWYGRAALGGGVCNYDEICRTLHAFRLLQGRVASPTGALDQLVSEGLHVSVVSKDQGLVRRSGDMGIDYMTMAKTTTTDTTNTRTNVTRHCLQSNMEVGLICGASASKNNRVYPTDYLTLNQKKRNDNAHNLLTASLGTHLGVAL